jgi:hypothetical protein
VNYKAVPEITDMLSTRILFYSYYISQRIITSAVLVNIEVHTNISLCANVLKSERMKNGKRTEGYIIKAWP